MDYGNYTTTSYGAQGGGGFMPGETNSPAGSRQTDNATIRPVTIKQVLDAVQPHPSAAHQIDGVDLDSLYLVGQVRNISSLTTHIIYKIDDGTGEIEVKHYINLGDSMDVDGSKPETEIPQVEQNGYAKIFGKLVAVGNKRYIGTRAVRPVTNINEVHYHFLEATAIHLFFTRGPPGGAAESAAIEHPERQGSMTSVTVTGADDYGAASQGRPLPPMSPVARRVYNLLKSEPQSNEGLHAHMIATKLQLPVTEAIRGADELVSAGLIFSTVDEHTWAILEY